MPPRLIIRGGTLVLPDGSCKADLLIEGETISGLVAQADPRPEDTVIDAGGMLVLPGIIDAHTHIRLDTGLYKTADNWESGTRAAAAGGVTTVIDFANQIPGESFARALQARQAESVPSLIDYTYHMVILNPARASDQLRRDLQSILDLGLVSLKLFTTYRPNYYLDDARLLGIFRALPAGMIAMLHCENDSLVTDATARLVEQGRTGWKFHAQGRPAEAEIEAVNRAIRLAALPDEAARLYIAHCSTADSVLDIVQHREQGRMVFCETCPQYLLLDDSVYAGAHPEHYILQPPLRPAENHERLRELVRLGLIDVLSTDTCDYTLTQKRASPDFTRTPGGLPGIETLLPLMYTLFCDELNEPLTALIPLMTENPARIFGLYPRKGVLRIGSDADVVIYDPAPEGTIAHEQLHYLAGYSPYQGMRVKGRVRQTISRGEVIYRDGEFMARAGRGRFIAAVGR